MRKEGNKSNTCTVEGCGRPVSGPRRKTCSDACATKLRSASLVQAKANGGGWQHDRGMRPVMANAWLRLPPARVRAQIDQLPRHEQDKALKEWL